MMDKLPYLEESIGKKISEIDSKVRELSFEKQTLERLLLDARRENVGKTEAVRRNSWKRILVENSILKLLRKSSRPVGNNEMYMSAKSAVFELKDVTFRSHIKRMKDAGRIIKKGNKWILPEGNLRER